MWWVLVLLLGGDATVSASLEWEPGFPGTVRGRKYELTKVPPEGVKLPGEPTNARFAAVEVGRGGVLRVVLDLAGSPQSLYVDTDQDGDLAEERPRKWRARARGGVEATDTVVFAMPGEPEPLPVELVFWRPSPSVEDAVYVATRIHRRGLVELGGRLRAVALVDGNGDVRFDDPGKDIVYLDVDANERFETGDGSHERLALGTPFHVAGRGYVASVPDPLGAVVEFREVKPAPKPAPWLLPKLDPPERRDAQPRPGDSLEALAARFRQSVSPERIDALQRIARLGTKEAFAFLEEAAESAPEEIERAWAVHGMGHVQYRAFAAKAARFARPSFPMELRRQSVFALHNMDAPQRASVYAEVLASLTDAAEKPLASAAAEYLGFLGTKASRAALVKAFRAQKDFYLRLEIYDRGTLADPDGPPRELVEAALEDPESAIQGRAVRHLYEAQDRRARELAIAALARPDLSESLAWFAAEVVAREGDPAAVRAFVGAIDRLPDSVVEHAGRFLRRVREPGSVRAIAAGLRSEQPRARAFSAGLLAPLREGHVTDALASALEVEKDAEALERIAEALVAHADPRTLPQLLAAAKRADPERRGALLDALARVGAGDAAVAVFFRQLRESSRWEDRALALDVAARARDAGATAAGIANLDHEAWQVRLAAVDLLAALRTKEAIAPLVARLDREELPRVRDAIGEALFRLTGQRYLDIADAWRRWWAEVGPTFEVPPEAPKARTAPDASVATFYGLPIRSDRVCFLLDRSESMEAVDARSAERRTRFATASAELLAALSRMRDGTRFNVICFDSEIRPWKERAVGLDAKSRRAVEAFLAKQVPEGATNLHDALDAALRDGNVDTIFVLSDGAPTAGKLLDADGILRAVRRLNRFRRIAIHAVAIGQDSVLLRDLANENRGTYARR